MGLLVLLLVCFLWAVARMCVSYHCLAFSLELLSYSFEFFTWIPLCAHGLLSAAMTTAYGLSLSNHTIWFIIGNSVFIQTHLFCRLQRGERFCIFFCLISRLTSPQRFVEGSSTALAGEQVPLNYHYVNTWPPQCCQGTTQRINCLVTFDTGPRL